MDYESLPLPFFCGIYILSFWVAWVWNDNVLFNFGANTFWRGAWGIIILSILTILALAPTLIFFLLLLPFFFIVWLSDRWKDRKYRDVARRAAEAADTKSYINPDRKTESNESSPEPEPATNIPPPTPTENTQEDEEFIDVEYERVHDDGRQGAFNPEDETSHSQPPDEVTMLWEIFSADTRTDRELAFRRWQNYVEAHGIIKPCTPRDVAERIYKERFQRA